MEDIGEAPAVLAPFGHVAEDHVDAREVGGPHARLARQRVVARGDQVERVGGEQNGVVLRVDERADHVADVDLVVRQRELLALGADVAELHLDMRVELAEAGDRPRHELGGGEGHIGDAHSAGAALGDAAGGRHRVGVALQQLDIVLVEATGRRR